MEGANRSGVSVIVPAYNCERYLAAALASATAQSFEAREIIVVDDGSTDDTAAVARGFAPAVRCIRQENTGQAAARNRGIQSAAGDVVAFLDADDLWHEEKLSRQIAVLDANPEIDVVLCHVRQFTSPELAASPAEETSAPPQPGYITSAVVIRRSSLDEVGHFAPEARAADFVEWWTRVTEMELRVAMLPQVLVHRRLHADNLGRDTAGANREILRFMKASLDRRRERGRPQ